MNTTKSEIIKIITAIKVQCPEALPYKNEVESDILVDMWFEILKGYPKEIVWAATRNALKHTVYQKQNWIGAICQEIDKMQVAYEQTETELWDELLKAVQYVRRVTYFGMVGHWDNGRRISPPEEVQKALDGLSPLLRDYVHGTSELVALSRQDTLEYEKARFLKTLPQLKQREKIRKESGMLAGLIESAAEQKAIERRELKQLGQTKSSGELPL